MLKSRIITYFCPIFIRYLAEFMPKFAALRLRQIGSIKRENFMECETCNTKALVSGMAQEFDIAKLSQYIINKKGIVWIQDEPIRSFGY